jgi:hypothetical protein
MGLTKGAVGSKRKIIAAVHQPNYFPWLGYFDKIIKSDVFIFYNTCRKDSKLGWAKRVKIKSRHGAQWLGFPIKKVSRDNEGRYPFLHTHEILDFKKNRDQHLCVLNAEYEKAPYYKEIIRTIEEIYKYENYYISEFNLNCIKQICGLLNINTRLEASSNLGVYTTSNEGNRDLVRQSGANVYLSGDGSDAYIKEEVFREAGLGTVYQKYRHPVYRQSGAGDFIPGLSIIDSLMNLGISGVKRILKIGR